MQFWRNDIHRFGQNYQEKHYFGLNFQEKNLEGLPQPIFAKNRCAIALSYCVINAHQFLVSASPGAQLYQKYAEVVLF